MNKLKSLVLFAAIIICAVSYGYSQTVPGQVIGKPVTDIKGKILNGKNFTLSENFRGAPTIIVFWSTSCPICHANIPKMNAMKTRLETSGKGKVNFLAVTIDKEPKINSYIKKYPFNFTIVPNAAVSLIEYAPKKNGAAAMSYPSIFVIDKEGVLVYSKEGGGQTEKVEEVLNNLLQSK